MDNRGLLEQLAQCGNNITRLAQLLGRPRETIRDQVHKARAFGKFAGQLNPDVPRPTDGLTRALTLEEQVRRNFMIAKERPQRIHLPKGNTLFIADTQCPFQHEKAFDFLQNLRDEYDFANIVHVGDVVDQYFAGFYEKAPEALSAIDEIHYGREAMKALGEIFPNVAVAEGNHDMRVYRQAAKAGIPIELLRDMSEIMGTPTGWQFAPEVVIDNEVLVVHSCGHSDALQGVIKFGMSVVQGHHHTEAHVKYLSNMHKLMFGMTVGSLIDDKARAFSYNKNQIKRPILSSGVLINGLPAIIPMEL